MAHVPGPGELPLLDGDALPVFVDEFSAVLCATMAHRQRPMGATSVVVSARRESQLMAWSAIGGRRTYLVEGEGAGAIVPDIARRLLAWLDLALADEVREATRLQDETNRTVGATPGLAIPDDCPRRRAGRRGGCCQCAVNAHKASLPPRKQPRRRR